MSGEMVISIAEQAIWVILIVAAPLLLIALITGLLVSIFQATTQIQEQTLAFVPKIVAVMMGLIYFGPFMLTKVLSYTKDIFENLTRYIG